eukprot:58470-Amorphochlora_amoeboformis.AAC.2
MYIHIYPGSNLVFYKQPKLSFKLLSQGENLLSKSLPGQPAQRICPHVLVTRFKTCRNSSRPWSA